MGLDAFEQASAAISKAIWRCGMIAYSASHGDFSGVGCSGRQLELGAFSVESDERNT